MAELRTEIDRRASRRYRLHLPIHYRVSERGALPYAGTGTTCEMSTTGLSFRCRRALPVGAHVELTIDWPSQSPEGHPMELHLTGFILRTDHGRFGVRVNSHRFVANSRNVVAIGATA